MAQSRDNIISKIKKLLALASNNSSESEALQAALRAQRLIAEYDVEDSELNETQETISEIGSTPYKGKTWRFMLANIVAENFRCKSYTLNYRSWDDAPLHQQVFLGYKTDADAALLVFEKLAQVAEAKSCEVAKEIRSRCGTSRGVKNTFLVGFCYGVKMELEKQSQALMIVTPGLVKSAFDALNLDTHTGLELDKQSIDCSEEGTEAGRDAVRATRLGCKESEFLLQD